MSKKEKESPSGSDQAKGNGNQLLDGLEALLQEEGLDPSLDEEADEELDALFAEDEAKAAPATPAAPASRPRSAARSTRQDRRKGDQEAFKNLEVQMQLDPMGIQVADDKLTAWLSRITADNTYEEITQFLHSQGITTGIDQENIRGALAKARRGQAVFGVVVARGKPPRLVKGAELVYHLPAEVMHKKSPTSQMTDFERLKHALEGPHLDALKSYKGVARLVCRGEVLAEHVSAQVEPGIDVYGQPIQLEQQEELSMPLGDNTDLSEDGTACVSAIYGYAGLSGNMVTVLPPIWVSESLMEAYFVCVPLPEGQSAPPISAEELQELLEAAWVKHGLMEKQLELLKQRLERGQPLPATLPIARGEAEVPGQNARIQYAFDTYSVMKWNQLQTLWSMEKPEDLEKALVDLYAEEGTPHFTAFRPGQVVVEKVPATPGVVGRNIHGEEVLPEPGQDAPMEAGENLTLAKQGLQYAADCFGYACLQWDIQVTLRTPLWISPDKTRAYFVNLPQTPPVKHPSVEEMKQLLKRAGIRFGFSAERWAEILAELETGRRRDFLILIAQGSLAQPGRDAAFEWAIDVGEGNKVGKILEDGSIDFRERSLITVVKENDLLGRLIPPQPGVLGKDIFGSEMRPAPPLNIEVVTDSRIYAQPGDQGVIAFYAEVAGGISHSSQIKQVNKRTHKRVHIGIYPISTIEGDVGYSTGNIDFNGDVVVNGSVHPQFSVKATGSVTIGGYVEAGACVTAGNDILIKRGVVGASTELVAGGNVLSKYIQEATVRAGGDVKAGAYIFNASIRCGGQVVVAGKGEGKSRALVGGLVWGARGIVARSIGSPYNTSTKLVAGIDPEGVNRAEQIRANLYACQEKQRAMMEKIGLESLDVQIIKQKLAYCRNPKDKQKILLAIKRIAKIAELEQNLHKELEEIAEKQRHLAIQTSIGVQGEFFAGVELRIGEHTLIVQDDEEKVSYNLVQNEEELLIQKGPFRGGLR